MRDYFSFGEALDQYIEASASPASGVGTGYSLDKECGLMDIGELMLIWARSGAGKSTLLLNFINNTPDVPTVFFNMEMRARTMAEWLTTMGGSLSVDYHALKKVINDGYDDSRYEQVMTELEKAKAMANAPVVWMAEPRSPTLDDLARTVDSIEADTGIRPVRVFIDHLSLMSGARDYEGVVRMGEQLHQWAQDDGLAVVCAQQTGRSGGPGGERNDGHIPVTLSSGVFGGEHDADWVLGAWRPSKDPKFKKSRADFKKEGEYDAIQAEKRRVDGMTLLSVVKNRPFGTLLEDGLTLFWNDRTRKLEEEWTG